MASFAADADRWREDDKRAESYLNAPSPAAPEPAATPPPAPAPPVAPAPRDTYTPRGAFAPSEIGGAAGSIVGPPQGADHAGLATSPAPMNRVTATPGVAAPLRAGPAPSLPALPNVRPGDAASAAGPVSPPNAGFTGDNAQRREFQRRTGFPEGRPGFVIDYIVPLSRGGGKTADNMKWLRIDTAGAVYH